MIIHKYDSIISVENLLIVWVKFLRGKKNKKDVVKFQAELAANILNLHNDLKNKTYQHGSYSAFNISDPKPRNIHKATVRDRLLHRLIYEELYPYFENRFIFDSYSCRKNKGTHKALEIFKHFAGEVSKNHTKTCFVLKCDIKKFFANINHDVLMKILKGHILDKDILWVIEKIISSFCSRSIGIGLPLGNLTSQLLVNIYMHEFDYFVKRVLNVKYYIRYADDFVILSDNKSYLKNLLPKLNDFLNNKLHLKLHENKVFIKTYSSGVDFLGWVHFSHYRSIRTSTKRKIIKTISHYPRRETINSYRGLLGHGNTYKLKRRIGIC
ncbi:group II intron reverse transcriptase domain-containing protein [Candidatus Nomurabacteria bacterium]|nr:group II intron reverse transcriptase domain-containing protein [Candidatus Nomurabacteria bacterium]